MWLIDSSVGRKVVMSVTGTALILFLTFHGAMNCVALISGEAYNAVCEFLGANWYALVGTVGLAALVLIHFLYAFILEIRNIKAVGGLKRYSRQSRPQNVEWASQNMLVLGIIVILGLALHLTHFWANMQLQEIIGSEAVIDGKTISPTDGAALIAYTFGKTPNAILYIVWLGAIWLHLSHGFWSAMQTLGWNNQIWLNRWKTIGIICVTFIVLMFVAVVVAFWAKANILA